jgi:eight-cysteine-cluster-containing protein
MARKLRSFVGPALFAICTLVGAAAAGRHEAQQVPKAPQERQNTGDREGACPEGWFDAEEVQILCIQGSQPVERTFTGTRCVRCLPAKERATRCEGAWRPATAEFGCAPGYELVYSQEGDCKRCKAARTGCKQDAECLRTGCSGQICASERVVTTCEWRDEYACYRESFAHCACINGSCGWAPNPDLLQCVNQAYTGTPGTGGTSPSPTEPPQSP